MKTNRIKIALAAVVVTAGAASAALAKSYQEKSVEKTGTVERVLINPRGEADGLLLTDGVQVKFPPHLAASLNGVAMAKESVKIVGKSENEKIIRATKITNAKSGQSVEDTGPKVGSKSPPEGGPKAGRPPGPPPPLDAASGLAAMTAQGKIQTQLLSPRGDVEGVILSDATIVRFPPHIGKGTKAKLDVGQSLRASGFGTKNDLGQALEATDLVNE